MEKNKIKQKIVILIAVMAVIVVIAIIAGVLIMKEYKTKSTEKSISTESQIWTGIPIKFTYFEDYWKKYDLTNAVYKTQEEYENAVRNYINEIAILLNRQNWYEQYTGMDTLCLELHISDLDDESTEGTISSYKESLKQSICTYDLNLSNTMFKNNRSQLVQAVAHLIITRAHGVSSDMEEGLAEYIQDNLGMGIASINYGVDIHNYLIEYTKLKEKDANLMYLMGLIKDHVGKISHIITPPSSGSVSFNFPVEDISVKYNILCKHSFIDYLVQKYGIESVMKIIDGYDDSIYNLYNQNGLGGLIADWKLFLENYSCKMTWDEIDTHITELKKTHDY